MRRLEKNMLFVWVFLKFLLLWSLDHPLPQKIIVMYCWLCLIFLSQGAYISIHYSLKSLDQESLLKSILVGQNILGKPGWSGPSSDHPTKSFCAIPDDPAMPWIIQPRGSNLSDHFWMIWPLPGSSGSLCPDLSGQVRMIRLYPGSSGPNNRPI